MHTQCTSSGTEHLNWPNYKPCGVKAGEKSTQKKSWAIIIIASPALVFFRIAVDWHASYDDQGHNLTTQEYHNPPTTITTNTTTQLPQSKSCIIKVMSNLFQVVAKLRRVSQRKITKTKYFVRVRETCFAAQESPLPWEVKSLRCTAGPGV